MGLEDSVGEIKQINIEGPYRGDNLYVGYGSVVRGRVRLGNNVVIGNGTYIISENSSVIIGDGVEIGDNNVIKVRDHDPRNKNLDIIIGEGTITKVGVVLENGITLGRENYIGDYSDFGRNIVVGDKNRFNQYSNIPKNVRIGNRNTFYVCTVGSAPQGQVHEDEGTSVEIGDDNLFREYVVINRGSRLMGIDGKTKIGNRNKIFSQTHIGHDCIVGDDNEIVSGTFLGGHVRVGNRVRISGKCGVQQFVHIGNCAFIGGMVGLEKNVLPYSRVEGKPAGLHGINFKRLEKLYGKSKCREIYGELRRIFEVIMNRDVSDEILADKIREQPSEYAREIADFIDGLEKNKRIYRFRHEKGEENE